MFKAIINMNNLRKFPENGMDLRQCRDFFNEIAQYVLADYIELVRVFRKYNERPILGMNHQCRWPEVQFEGNCDAGKMILVFDDAQQYECFKKMEPKVGNAIAYTEVC